MIDVIDFVPPGFLATVASAASAGAATLPSVAAVPDPPVGWELWLPAMWFVLLGVLLAGYAVLDGFDLGVGIVHPFVSRSETDRRLLINSIGPLWDGNEVWLVTFGGAMFAMFPYAYATIFSAFYTAFMLLLFALIFRAVSMEFRGKMQTAWARRAWDHGFFGGSFLATLLFGVAVGNVMRGIPLDEQGTFTGTLVDQLHPYALATGVLAVVLFALHGALYLHLKTEGDLQRRLRRFAWWLWVAFIGVFVVVSGWTLLALPHASDDFRAHPWLLVVPVLNALAIANVGRGIHRGRAGYAFVSSGLSIIAFVFLLMAALFPSMIHATDPAFSLSVRDAASSPTTLKIGLLFALLGMPCVLAYTAVVYWTFRGKTTLEEHSY